MAGPIDFHRNFAILLGEDRPTRQIVKTRRTSDAVEMLRRLAGDSPRVQRMLRRERAGLQIARQVHDLRLTAGLSQVQLAAKIGTTQSVISRLEDADYDGHSLAMLRKIAAAVGHEVEVHFVPRRASRRKLLPA